MTDMTQQQLEQAIDQEWLAIADEVFDQQLEASIKQATDAADFRVSDDRLTSASMTAADALPMNLRLAAFAGEASGWAMSATDGSDRAKVNTGKVLAEADDEKRKSAAEGVRDYICNQLRQWFEDNFEQLKKWLEELGIKGTLKKLAALAKQLIAAAVTAVAGVVGSMFLAYLLIGIAVAAVGAAIYFAVKKGLPNYCAA